MKKRGILYLVLALSLGSFITIYLLLGFYYSGSFAYGTWINHVYCTGKTVNEANNELKNNTFYNGIVVSAADGEKYFINSDSIDFSIDYYDELKNIMDSQNPFIWGENLFISKNREIPGSPSFDEEKLEKILLEWNLFDVADKPYYQLKKNDGGYYLETSSEKTANFRKVYDFVKDAVYQKKYEADVSSLSDFYDDIKATEDDMKVYDLFERIDKVQNNDASIRIAENKISAAPSDITEWMITLDELDKAIDEEKSEENPGNGYFIAGDKVIEFPRDYRVEENIVTDKDGNILLSCSNVYDFICDKLAEIDTNQCIERYQKDGKGLIYVSGNKNGKLYDENKEYENFVNSIDGAGPAVSEIALPNKSLVLDGAELGKEYILVDMGNQHLRYYKNGKICIEYDIVTGNIGLGRGTPVGLYHIYNKRYHTILRGADYASFVNYWLGVNKGIGIHDATWRKEFGGEIYKRSGSHGCINSPLDLMEKLYNQVEVGVPVLLYY
ncbi:L,D-transpeptidase [Butyrivibrio sp. WCE2006]|uniref:L,D-transpeptidase n=1 Tax=Butyrivibrio sp. WCE2006 TaxID=1410611 RepID=UPI0005D23851|nr:L,D-transpeptidase [Butyrivibrio sp. WCE2006]